MVLTYNASVPLAPPVSRTREGAILHFMVQTHIQVEKLRISGERHSAILLKEGFNGSPLNEVRQRTREFEEYLETEIERLVMSHPAWPWLSQVKGVGTENAGKVLAFIGDIARFSTVSKLWSYAGYGVENGEAPRKMKGQKVTWNENLRTMCWRLGTSMIRAGGAYYHYYLNVKESYDRRYEGQIVKAKKGTPVPPGMITAKHIHNMALRRMIKLFLSHLWEKWREAEGLPGGTPYALERLGYAGVPIKPFVC